MGASLRRIPTGVSDFDNIVKGGMPLGSVVLLLGDLGAGQKEYAMTSAAKLSLVRENPRSAEFYLGTAFGTGTCPSASSTSPSAAPRRTSWRRSGRPSTRTSTTASSATSSSRTSPSKYFRQTLVPRSWTGDGASALFSNDGDQGTARGLVDYLDENAQDSMVVIDSLTDLVVSTKIETIDLVAVLRGMQRVSKRWDGVVYLLLTKDVVDEKMQRMIMDSVDGALVFEWSKLGISSRRQRYMYVEKFMSILPHLDKERVARFATMVTAQQRTGGHRYGKDRVMDMDRVKTGVEGLDEMLYGGVPEEPYRRGDGFIRYG